jgi:hypothetical protein
MTTGVTFTEEGELEFDLQELINSGDAWRLEGSVGRAAMEAITSGQAMLGPKPVRDYWGNLVPAWWMVEAGTEGSPEFAGLERPEEPSQEEKVSAMEAAGLTLH